MVSICEHPDKRRDGEQAKDADRLAPKGTELVQEVLVLLSWTTNAPGGKGGPNPLRQWDGTR